MSSPPVSPVAQSSAATALAHLFDSPTPPRPTAGRGRPGSSALFLNSPTSSVGGGSPLPASRQRTTSRFELASRELGAATSEGVSSAGPSTGSRTGALALFDDVDLDDAALDAEINGTTAGVGDDGLDGIASSSALGKRIVPKIDEARLLGDQGITTLVKRARTMKFRGKGREIEDLGNLLDHYHVWAHTLFPKSKFKDTIRTVERVCKRRAMTSSIARFKLEFDPPAPVSPSPPSEARTGDSPLPEVMFASSRARSASPMDRRPLFARGGSHDENDSQRRVPGRAEAVARALAATSVASDLDDDYDIDDLIRQAENDARVAETEMTLGLHASRPQPIPTQWAPATARSADDEDEMEIDWAELDAIDAEIAAGSGRSALQSTKQRAESLERLSSRATSLGEFARDVDEEDWDAFNEMHG